MRLLIFVLFGLVASASANAGSLLDLLDSDSPEIRHDTLKLAIHLKLTDPETQKRINVSKLLYILGGVPNLPRAPKNYPRFTQLLEEALSNPKKLKIADGLPLLSIPNFWGPYDKEHARKSAQFPVADLYKVIGDTYVSIFQNAESNAVVKELGEQLSSTMFLDPLGALAKVHPGFLTAIAEATLAHPNQNSIISILYAMRELPTDVIRKASAKSPAVAECIRYALRAPFETRASTEDAFQILMHYPTTVIPFFDPQIEGILRDIVKAPKEAFSEKSAKEWGFFFNENKLGALQILAKAQSLGLPLSAETVKAVTPYSYATNEDVFLGTEMEYNGIDPSEFRKPSMYILSRHQLTQHLGVKSTYCPRLLGETNDKL